jgi:hypothetical protein
MSKEKKKFKDTVVGKFITERVPGVLDAIDDVFPPAKLLTALVGKSLSPEDQIKFNTLLLDYEQNERRDYLADTSNARQREIEVAKAGGNDHLMYVAGYTALISFLGMISAVIFVPGNVSHNPLFHQLMGIIEGVALTVFTYYFGSSKGSADKSKMLKQ